MKVLLVLMLVGSMLFIMSVSTNDASSIELSSTYNELCESGSRVDLSYFAVESGHTLELAGLFENAEQRGCCSHHGGVCGCENGRKVCCDGTYSPSCTC